MRVDQDLDDEQDEAQTESMIDTRDSESSHPLEETVSMEDESEQQLSPVLATIHSTGTAIDIQSQPHLNSTYDSLYAYQTGRSAYEASDFPITSGISCQIYIKNRLMGLTGFISQESRPLDRVDTLHMGNEGLSWFNPDSASATGQTILQEPISPFFSYSRDFGGEI